MSEPTKPEVAPFDVEGLLVGAPGAPVSPIQKRAGEGGVGRPPFQPTETQRRTVAMMIAAGIPHVDIVQVLINPQTGKPIDGKTFAAHFDLEINQSGPMANTRIAQSLFKKATGDGPQAVTAAIFWAKCRMGWKERTVIEAEIRSGVLVAPPGSTPEAWIANAALANAKKTEPGQS
jgi:hypothetical protein